MDGFPQPIRSYGNIIFLENTGTAMAPVFAVNTADNPFGNMEDFSAETQDEIAPVFEDLDGDGDLDLIAGGLNGALMFLENDGGTFSWIEANDLGIDDVGNNALPTIADVDEDGDLDILISKGGDVTYFQNKKITYPKT